MFCNHQQNNWSELLHTAELAYNNHHHPSIGMSPFKVDNGYDMTLTGSGPTQGHDIPLCLALLKKLQECCQIWLNKAQEQQKQVYNHHHQAQEALKEGDQVWLSSQDLTMD
jgi:hypothetical protein